ncbi:MAG: SAM-dependent methyltransferase [Nitrospira sp.]|nr:SAM-dependent methyltransferase [Nitrospira sp.]MDD9859397.1 SAM-dependent methyltransferase [Nitrospira sp.]
MQPITTLIERTGPLTFARFMELALYEETDGYYMKGAGLSRSRTSPIGMEGGDFFTAPCLSPLLARGLVRQLVEIDDCLGHPAVFHLVEMGPGDGTLLRDMLQECGERHADLLSRLACVLVERSPALRRHQQDTLSAWATHEGGIRWVDDVSRLSGDGLTGMLFSNELVDAFPVHRVRMERDGLRELYVTRRHGEFVEIAGETSTPELALFLADLGVELPEGFTTEINLNAVRWIEQVARVLDRGVVVTIDYGHTSRDYFSRERRNGTLMGYYRHRVSTNPYTLVGEQDLTAHVNFSSLARAGGQAGLATTGLTNLMYFLMSMGIDDMVQDHDRESDTSRAAAQLLRHHGMGTTFKVLIQHKGIERPTLRGLRHRPFFESALTAAPDVPLQGGASVMRHAHCGGH